MNIKSYENFIYLGIHLTNNAVMKIEKIMDKEEQNKFNKLLKDNRKNEVLNIIVEDEIYDFYLKDVTQITDKDRKIRLIMASDTDNVNNQDFIKKIGMKTVCIDGVNKDKQHFLITNLYLSDINYGNKKSDGYFQRIKLCTSESIRNICISDNILSKINLKNKKYQINGSLDIQEQMEKENTEKLIVKKEIYRTIIDTKTSNLSDKVLKRIDEWDSYLKIIEEKARDSQLEIQYKGYRYNQDFTKCTMIFKSFTEDEVKKLKNFKNDRVILYYDKKIGEFSQIIEDRIGQIDKINIKDHTIAIELNDEIQQLLLQKKLELPKKGFLRISKMGDLAQAMNLRRGLNLLKMEKYLNKQLPSILFESEHLEYKKEEKECILDDENLLLNTLNNSQRKAVQSALNVKDVFLIQGPPGTGKTTVIAEICYQNAIRGLKTLIASQSNLAVDNALGRIIDNPKIRALRSGNISKVESEGEKYTEANVVKTWLDATVNTCKANYKNKEFLLKKINSYMSDFIKYKEYKEEIKKLEINITNSEVYTENLKDILRQISILQSSLSTISLEVDIDKQLKLIELINKTIFDFSEYFEKVYGQNFLGDLPIVHDLNRLYDNNLNFYTKSVEILNLENEIKILKSMKEHKDKLKSIHKFLIDHPNNNNLIDDYEKYKNINKKIEILKSRIPTLKKYMAIVNFRINELVSLKIEYSICHEDINYFIEKEVNPKIIDQYLIKTASIIRRKPKLMGMLKSLGIIPKWNIELLKYIYIGNQYSSMIREKIQYYNRVIENLNTQLIDIEEKYKDIIYHEYKIIEDKINDIKQFMSSYFDYDEKTTSILEYIKDVSITNIKEMTKRIYIKKENEIMRLNIIQKKYNNIKKANKEFNDKYIEVINMIMSRISVVDDKTIISEIEKLKEETENYLTILNEWINKIENSNFGDKEELKNLYIEFANVIGITCVQSGSKKFESEYKDFDVVIIDESSKATPPELLLPMLKGKKIILVGDHKQLPPVIESELLDEMKFCNDEIEDMEYEIDDMKNSIFEKIYMNISYKNKIMLDTQYRMHSSIMNCINQFYKDDSIGDNKLGLKSGVENEEVVKNHNIDIGYIKRENHLMWIDIPLHDNFTEKSNENFSFYNKTEVEVIEQILYDINDNNFNNDKKQVSVITFYSAQAKLLNDKLIKSKKYNNLNLRVGTVDKFQGIESEIVIVSFVRNNKNGKIGFAKDPRRINVALSRAQKLLVIVGCSELYCDRNNNRIAKGYYKEVIKVVNEYNGVIDAGVIFNYGVAKEI